MTYLQEQDIVLLDKRKCFIGTKNKVYYTLVSLPICESQYSEFIEFYFDKKGFLQSMVFQIFEYPQQITR